MVKSLYTGGAKLATGGFKATFGRGMSHSWGATTSRWKNAGINPSGYKHHWAISQRTMERFPSLKPFGNQMWNIKSFSTQASHMRWAHGQKYMGIKYPMSKLLYPITSTPWNYYIRLDSKKRDLELDLITLNYEKKKKKLQSLI